MRDLYAEREAAEQIWLEEWEEIQAEEHLLKLWMEAQDKAKETEKEVDRLLASGECELIF